MAPFLIVNPKSAAGRTGRHFDRIARAVRAAIGEFECAFTQGPGDVDAKQLRDVYVKSTSEPK